MQRHSCDPSEFAIRIDSCFPSFFLLLPFVRWAPSDHCDPKDKGKEEEKKVALFMGSALIW